MTSHQSLYHVLLCFDTSVSVVCPIQGEIATWQFQMPVRVIIKALRDARQVWACLYRFQREDRL